MALPASDTFLQTTGSAQALTAYSANWSYVVGAFQVASGTGYVSPAASGVDGAAFWNADVFNADQYAEVITATGWAAAGIYVGPAVRCSAGNGYAVEANASEWYLGRIISNAWSTMANGTWSAADGNAIRLEGTTPNGSTVRLVLLRNGVTVTTFDDTNASRILSGSAGIGGYDNTSSPGIADWTGGNLGGGGGASTSLLLPKSHARRIAPLLRF